MAKKSDVKVPKSILPAVFFGFKYENDPFEVLSEDVKNAKPALKEKGYLHTGLFPIEELVALQRYYKTKDPSGISPFLVATSGITNGPHEKHRKKANEVLINLHFLGVVEPISEAIIIKAAELVLKSDGHKNLLVKLNNIGGKSAQNTFNREATNYYRKHMSELNINLRQMLKKGIFELYTNGQGQCQEVHENAPEPMDFLGEETREHFSSMLEYIEALNFHYEVDCHLMGDQNYSSHTIFEIIDTATKKVYATGTRYNLLAKKTGHKREIPAISVMIKVDDRKMISIQNLEKQTDKPDFFLIQMGPVAKIKALKLLGNLTEAGIYVKHSIYRDKISTQLLLAKKSEAKYHIIIGHKEALEDSVIVKGSQGRWQKTVAVNNLFEYLKTLK